MSYCIPFYCVWLLSLGGLFFSEGKWGGADLGEWGSAEELRGVEGGKTEVKI